MKHIFILKPDTDHHLVNTIVSIMQGRYYELRYTQNIDDATMIASEYQDSQEVCRLYAIGGDGFVHKVANGMVGSQNELVVIPQGTGNDFARAIYDTLDPVQILKQSLTIEAHPIDLIQCNDTYCINVFCCGLDAEVANHVNEQRHIRFIPRPLHYVYTVFQKIFHLKFYPTTVCYHHDVLYDDEVVIAAFCNGRYFGGGFLIGHDAKNDDGYIDMNIIGGINKKELIFYVKALIEQKLNQTKKYVHYKKEEVTVTCSQRPNIDGEIFPPGIYHLKVKHHAILLVAKK